MKTQEIAHPKIATRAEWHAERLKLLSHEKELTRQKDVVNAERRRLPMVRVEKEYVFEGPKGKQTLAEIFDGQKQLIIYHFMFGPDWEKGCPGCTGFVNALGNLSPLQKRDTTFALVSRAPLPKLEAYKAEKGWSVPCYSSFRSNFNYDFHVTHDESKAPIEYNYMDKAALIARRGHEIEGEDHGLSVFFRLEDEVFHTYSVYARGVEGLTDTYSLLDVTPYGRQEDFEDSPRGWPQYPTYG